MMYKFGMSVYKEILLLKRDFGGLVILFVMPLALIITITLVQDNTFKSISESQIPVLLIDNDQGSISETIKKNLTESGSFSIITKLDGKSLTETAVEKAVFSGKYQMAIVIPEHLSRDLSRQIDQNVNKILTGFGIADSVSQVDETEIKPKEVKLYFDPATQETFKSGIRNGIDKMVSQIETKSVYGTFQDQLGDGEEITFDHSGFFTFKEVMQGTSKKELAPNSVQHNVPAWALFAIFFVVVPLSINIVKEKGQGTQVRLITNPVPYALVIAGKTFTYVLICMIQFFLMVAVGIYLFPYLGLPTLDVSGKLALMSVVALFSGLAAIGFGILLGTIAKTHEQSAPFGATMVVILAALGGVWVPVFIMPLFMQYLSHISPMNWGLNAFYDVLLRNGNLLQILPEIILLLLFFLITTTIAILYDKKKRAV